MGSKIPVVANKGSISRLFQLSDRLGQYKQDLFSKNEMPSDKFSRAVIAHKDELNEDYEATQEVLAQALNDKPDTEPGYVSKAESARTVLERMHKIADKNCDPRYEHADDGLKDKARGNLIHLIRESAQKFLDSFIPKLNFNPLAKAA